MAGTNDVEYNSGMLHFPASMPKPGPVHTIQSDEQENTYYSDELNHSVISLDAEGRLRWSAMGKGADPGQFFYPRGIGLGWIFHEGQAVRCLGVADSWNRRIQFLRLDTGRFLAEWCSSGADAFHEPVDIRYIPFTLPSELDPISGYWLVLDKGKSCLWSLDVCGRKLRHWGSFTDPGTAAKWLSSGSYPNLQVMDQQNPSEKGVYDLLFYPSRILGRGPEALFVWEPYGRCLKIIAYGSFLPIFSNGFPDTEWLAADETGLLEWSHSSRSYNFYNCSGKLVCSGSTEGTPVPSNLPADEFWTQEEDGIRRVKLRCLDLCLSTRPVQSILLNTAETKLKGISIESIGNDVQAILHTLDRFISLAGRVAAALKDRHCASDSQSWAAELEILTKEWDRARGELYSDLRVFNLPVLFLRIAACSGELETAGCSLNSMRLWNQIHKRITSKLADIVVSGEDVFIRSIPLSMSSKLEGADIPQVIPLAERVYLTIRSVAEWILKWNGLGYRTSAHMAMPGTESNLDVLRTPISSSGLSILQKKTEIGNRAAFLRELPPFDCAAGKDDPVTPTYMVGNSSGELFISQERANRIITMDASGCSRPVVGNEGSAIKLNQPNGIAFDSKDRLWIADSANRRVLVLDPSYKSIVRIYEPPEVNLKRPHGLLALKNDEMLLTDQVENSVLKFDSHGSCRVLLNELGSGLNCVRFPSSFCIDVREASQYIWLVEKRNHRLLKLDVSGRAIEKYGTCGLIPGSLFYPMTMAMFSDGVSVVAQGMPYPSLIFLSAKMEEIARLYLDYYALGLFIQGDLLYVCDYGGNLVHRYVRVK